MNLQDGYTCVTGSRDSSICCWDLRRLVRPEETTTSNALGSPYVVKRAHDQHQVRFVQYDMERLSFVRSVGFGHWIMKDIISPVHPPITKFVFGI